MNHYRLYTTDDTSKSKNEDVLIDNTNMEFIFVPMIISTYYDKFMDLTDGAKKYMDLFDEHISTIKATHLNESYLKDFIMSKRWLDQIDYQFNDLRPFITPYYTPELYYLSNIKQNIINIDGILCISISGTLKKFSYEQIHKKYEKDDAINKTWKDKTRQLFSVKHFFDIIDDGFYKSTYEGEIIIPNLGRMYVDYHMYLIIYD
jgi:hypothetical protein